MLPALIERDLPAFGEAVYDFNARVGEMFAPIQGGLYAHPHLADLVALVRRQGVRGVGQSSWGPTVFAIVADPDQANDLAGRLRQWSGLGTAEILVTQACNHGAILEALP
jgi:predicted sugar kinase